MLWQGWIRSAGGCPCVGYPASGVDARRGRTRPDPAAADGRDRDENDAGRELVAVPPRFMPYRVRGGKGGNGGQVGKSAERISRVVSLFSHYSNDVSRVVRGGCGGLIYFSPLQISG
jgi:hypothetical protein